ncbi:MAG: hypothetical protein ACJARW_000538 [Methylophilaceae bacterium]
MLGFIGWLQKSSATCVLSPEILHKMCFCFNLINTVNTNFLAGLLYDLLYLVRISLVRIIMTKLLSSKMQGRVAAKAVQQQSRKNLFVWALSTFLVLVVVSEGIRLALLNG